MSHHWYRLWCQWCFFIQIKPEYIGKEWCQCYLELLQQNHSAIGLNWKRKRYFSWFINIRVNPAAKKNWLRSSSDLQIVTWLIVYSNFWVTKKPNFWMVSKVRLVYPEPGSNRHGSESTGVWDQRVYQFRHPGVFC